MGIQKGKYCILVNINSTQSAENGFPALNRQHGSNVIGIHYRIFMKSENFPSDLYNVNESKFSSVTCRDGSLCRGGYIAGFFTLGYRLTLQRNRYCVDMGFLNTSSILAQIRSSLHSRHVLSTLLQITTFIWDSQALTLQYFKCKVLQICKERGKCPH